MQLLKLSFVLSVLIECKIYPNDTQQRSDSMRCCLQRASCAAKCTHCLLLIHLLGGATSLPQKSSTAIHSHTAVLTSHQGLFKTGDSKLNIQTQ